MKRKTLLIVLIIAILSAMITMPVMAAGEGANEPIYDNTTFKVKGANAEFFFANGTPIIIEARTDGEAGALIKWNGGSQKVGPNAYIFGGMHDDATKVSTSITMKGGTVRVITGGGLHKSYTVKSNVVIQGGNVGAVQGGGCDGISWTCGCIANTKDTNSSTCQTEVANVTVNGGIIKYSDASYGLVYGGGEGYSNTGKSNVTINGGNLLAAYVTAGGSNGNTTNAALNITGGKIMIAQTVNRGTMTNGAVKVIGGEIGNLYCAAMHSSTSEVGRITGTVTVEVSGNAKVEKMQFGQMGNQSIVAPNEVVKKENIKIVSGTVKDSSLLMDNVTRLEAVKIDGKTYIIQPGDTVKDIPEYSSIIKKDGYKFIGFTWAQGAWDINQELIGDIELTTVFEKVEEPKIENNEENKVSEESIEVDLGEKDNTPNTGGETTTFVVSVTIAIVSLTGLTLIKRKKEVNK